MKISLCVYGVAQESQMSLCCGQSLHLTQLFQYASQRSELLISRQSTQNGICPCAFTRREEDFPSFQPLRKSRREVPLISPCTCKTEQLEGGRDRKLAWRNRDLGGLKVPFYFPVPVCICSARSDGPWGCGCQQLPYPCAHRSQIQQSDVWGPHFLSLGMQALPFGMHENGPLLVGNLAVNSRRIKELHS